MQPGTSDREKRGIQHSRHVSFGESQRDALAHKRSVRELAALCEDSLARCYLRHRARWGLHELPVPQAPGLHKYCHITLISMQPSAKPRLRRACQDRHCLKCGGAIGSGSLTSTPYGAHQRALPRHACSPLPRAAKRKARSTPTRADLEPDHAHGPKLSGILWHPAVQFWPVACLSVAPQQSDNWTGRLRQQHQRLWVVHPAVQGAAARMVGWRGCSITTRQHVST